jgi:hypothetical protein
MLWDKEKGRRRIMPPIITCFIMVIILCTAGITRIAVGADRVNSTRYTGIETANEADLYDNNDKMISMQPEGYGVVSDYREEDDTYGIYNYFLRDYLVSSRAEISDTQYNALKEKIKELNNIIKLEGIEDFAKMSFDGRAVAINIACQIYGLCGLELDIDVKGHIERIFDQSGDVLYLREDLPAHYNFQILAFIITISVMAVLLVFILLFGRKNKTLDGEGVHNGFNEKGYA